MNTKTTPRDFFLHLGAIVALVVSVVSIINLYFSIINYYFPDQLAGYFYAGNIAWPISVLIVMVPILYVFEYMINKDIVMFVEKAELWIRKWRVYLILFITGATIVGDIIALINVYLNGEISTRFLYKILVVVVISGIIFAYYLISKETNIQTISTRQKLVKKTISILGIVIAVVAIVLGFLVVGSPTKQRNLKFDTQRVNDLSNIQWQVVSYWQQKGKLPVALADMNDPINGFITPTDPETKTAYKYSAKGVVGNKASFELCANFALGSQDDKGRDATYGGGGVGIATDAMYSVGYFGSDDNWKHTAGEACFTRTIDPDRNPVNPKIN